MKSHNDQQQNQEHKIYLSKLDTWVEVTEDVYRAYYRDIWTTRKRAQNHHQCRCPKSRLNFCDADCLACKYHTVGDTLSLDYTIEDDEGNLTSFADSIADDSPDAQSILEDAELLAALTRRLEELDPDERRVCELIRGGMTERDIAKIMGYKNQSAVNHRKWKAIRKLRGLLRDYI